MIGNEVNVMNGERIITHLLSFIKMWVYVRCLLDCNSFYFTSIQKIIFKIIKQSFKISLYI